MTELKPARIIAIESSCDETACAVLENGRVLLASTVASQMDIHARYGGVFPEVASRQHVLSIVPVIEQTLSQTNLTLKDVETRLANWLIKRCPDPNSEAPVTVELKMTKRVLAAELGTVSETFSRTLAKFRQLKLLMVRGKTVTILCPAKLTSLLRRNLGE